MAAIMGLTQAVVRSLSDVTEVRHRGAGTFRFGGGWRSPAAIAGATTATTSSRL